MTSLSDLSAPFSLSNSLMCNLNSFMKSPISVRLFCTDFHCFLCMLQFEYFTFSYFPICYSMTNNLFSLSTHFLIFMYYIFRILLHLFIDFRFLMKFSILSSRYLNMLAIFISKFVSDNSE